MPAIGASTTVGETVIPPRFSVRSIVSGVTMNSQSRIGGKGRRKDEGRRMKDELQGEGERGAAKKKAARG